MKRANPEYALHCAVANFLAWALGPKIIWWHTPNQGNLDPRRAVFLKKMGLLAGVPDFLILTPDTLIFIEMKPEKGSLSPAQKTFHERAKALGYPCYVARSVERVQEILEQHGITLRARAA